MTTEENFTQALLHAYEHVTESAPPDGMTIDTPLADLDLDSLSRIELVSQIEAELGVTIENSVLSQAVTARDLYAAVATLASAEAGGN